MLSTGVIQSIVCFIWKKKFLRLKKNLKFGKTLQSLKFQKDFVKRQNSAQLKF